MLAQIRGRTASGERAPVGPELRTPGIGGQCARHGICYAGALIVCQPVPTANERDHVSGIAVDGSEPALAAAVQILCPQRPLGGLIELLQKALGLNLEDRAPTWLTSHLAH